MDAERQTEGDDEVKKTANSKRDVLFLELDRQLQRRLLCVPAAFSGRRSWEGDKYLLGKGVVIANSTTACASTIINQKGELVKSSEANTNEIVIVEMDHVTTPSA